jgi:alanyl-tRNA synthetase
MIYGLKLNPPSSFLISVARTIIQKMSPFYPILEQEQTRIITILKKEEAQFIHSLHIGQKYMLASVKQSSTITKEKAF